MNRESHGHRSPVRSGTYISWQHMKDRCYNKNSPDYPNYGAQGIRVCRRWFGSFARFLEDMGERPPGMTLDRIDPYGHYVPANCRWAPDETQRRNKRQHNNAHAPPKRPDLRHHPRRRRGE